MQIGHLRIDLSPAGINQASPVTPHGDLSQFTTVARTHRSYKHTIIRR